MIIENLKTAAFDFTRYNLGLYNAMAKENEPKNHIVISGTPRGGTTWLAEMMLTTPKSCLYWEPLRPFRFPEVGLEIFGKDIGWHPYIPENEQWDEAYHFFKAMFELTSPHPKSLVRNNPIDMLFCNQWVMKFVSANLLLPWLVKNFPVIPIYIVRHPCAVVASQMRHPAFKKVSDKFTDPVGKYNSLYLEFEEILEHINSKVGHLAAAWAISNVLPLRHKLNNKAWVTVSYEKLLLEPEYVLKSIFERINKELPDAIWEKISKPSSTTQADAAILKNENQLRGWKNTLTNKEVEEILSVVQAFGISGFSEDEEPNYDNLGY